MKYIFPIIITCWIFFSSITYGFSQNNQAPAFPGAEGHGKYTSGGRGGQVIYVTNLSDINAPGSFRYAVNQSGPRIIIFKVSGTIQLLSDLKINNGDVTIAGQTAPGDGICVRDYPMSVAADNVIIRYMRFRLGSAAGQQADALEGRFLKNIIIDHCSMSWSVDECVSFYQNENFTLQWCIISESLRNSIHEKGAHGYGGIWGGKNASFHHNLLAHHDSRNPRLGEIGGDAFALTDLVDLRNNVIYNWKGNSCYGGEAMNVNIVNCYYKPGPVTTKKERIIAIDKNTDSGNPVSNIWGKFYINGNVLETSERATNDNWTYGVFNQFHSKYGPVSDGDKSAIRQTEPFYPGEGTTHTATQAYEKVTAYAGASFSRDSVDLRIIHDVTSGTATFMDGGNGSDKGIIDNQDAVGGWPTLTSTEAPVDTDEDGMPDAWETENNLNPNSPNDAQLKSLDALYPNIEVYINSIVAGITVDQNMEGIPTGSKTPLFSKNQPQIFLNQTNKELIINHSEIIKTIKIYSAAGELILIQNFSQNKIKIPVSTFHNGIYLLQVLDKNRGCYSEKVILF